MAIYLVYLVLFIINGDVHNSHDDGPIKIMTYNIRLDHAGDNEDNWHYRKHDMVQFILLENADFIGVQEALHHQVTYLDSCLIGYNYIGIGRDDGMTKGEYMSIFYKTESWELLQDNTFWLSSDPSSPGIGWDAACNRVCTYGIFKNKANSSVISISNTHLDHVGKIARKNSIAMLEEHMVGRENDYPAVLMGDFNFTPDDSLYASICSNISDSRNSTDVVVEDYSGTYNGFKQGIEHNRRIDYIFFDPSGVEVINYRVPAPETASGRHVSDHFPVIAEIKIK